jgi:hypothetical protein
MGNEKMKRSTEIFLELFLGIACFFSTIYFLGRSLVFLSLLSMIGTTSNNTETYEVNVLLFVFSAFFSSLFLALGLSSWSSYQEVEKEVERIQKDLKKEKEEKSDEA